MQCGFVDCSFVNMVGACSAYGGEESRIQGFGGET